ncbi:MAG: hypothetical protein H0Z34_13330 [Brevibacillus sp.]|nr:hypothetical protein [Brevibacillus sp.]
MARDLEKDLVICQSFVTRVERSTSYKEKISAGISFACEARSGWPETIRYAMSLEQEIDRLRNELNILQEQLQQRRCGA